MHYLSNLLILYCCICVCACGKEVITYEDFSEKIEEDDNEGYVARSLQRQVWLNDLKGLDSPQSIAICGSLMVAVYYSATLKIFNLKTGELKATMKLPYEPYSMPHSNTISFGRDYYRDTDEFPLFYVSQWYSNSENGALVYRIVGENEQYRIELEQLIRFDDSLIDTVGAGQIDWVVNTDTDELLALTYKLPGDESFLIVEDNATIVTRCRLPHFSEGKEVTLYNEDIIGVFELEAFQYSQDKVYHEGHIYALAGYYVSPESLCLRDIDLNAEKIITKYDLSEYGGEPEGLSILDGELICTWVSSTDLYTFPISL